MWAAESWDPERIDKEFGWAAAIGMNSMRIYLHDEVWRAEGDAFLDRIDEFLGIAGEHGIVPLLVIFDDCWHEPTQGRQPDPMPGIHNSGWARSPGRDILLDPDRRAALRDYVEALFARFGRDERVLAWDLYNEVTNYWLPSAHLGEEDREKARAAVGKDAQRAASLRLLDDVFRWARASDPAQPLTAGAWNGDRDLNAHLHGLSDVVSFHNYREPERLEKLIGSLEAHGRPILCTEYMARRHGSTFANHLPIFRRKDISCWNWGLVDGKTQTKYAWEDAPDRWGEGEPEPWFHDIFHIDGAPYDANEAELLIEFTKRVVSGNPDNVR